MYFRWLKQKGTILTPDDLIRDNLACFLFDPMDVATKRKHNDWLNEYINKALVRDGSSRPRYNKWSWASSAETNYSSVQLRL